jgi:predicted transcriptional regulator
MTKLTKPSVVMLTVRMPLQLVKRLDAAAKLSDRSRSAELRVRLVSGLQTPAERAAA